MLYQNFRVIICLMLSIKLFGNIIFWDVHIPSASMENTLEVGSDILVLKQKYDNEIERGDIIVFLCEADNNEAYIKRVIGLPNEHIEIHNKNIYVGDENGFLLKEDYLKEDWLVDNDGYVFDVPEKSYLVLGDNRNDSYDSRYWELYDSRYVKENKVLGKAIFKYAPYMEVLKNKGY